VLARHYRQQNKKKAKILLSSFNFINFIRIIDWRVAVSNGAQYFLNDGYFN
jgi:hypothetical protein